MTRNIIAKIMVSNLNSRFVGNGIFKFEELIQCFVSIKQF